jgi:hypothetical protein
MRRGICVAVLFLIFSLVSPWTACAATNTTSADEAQQGPKKPLPKIDIKKIALEAAEKGVVPSGRPLMVLVEVKASEDFAGPFVVNLELKKGQEKQKFSEGIEKLKQGSNAFKWDLAGKPEDGAYSVSVEIVNEALKLKDKSSKMFRVGEKKAEISGQKKLQESVEAEPASGNSGTGTVKADTAKQETTKAKTTTKSTKSKTAASTKSTKPQTAASMTTSKSTKSKTTKSSGEGEDKTEAGEDKEDGKEDKKDDENKPSVSFGVVGDDEEDKPVGDIATGGSNVKEVSLFDIKFKGQFTETSPGVYKATGTIRPDWSFDISLGGAGTITIDTKNKWIDGVGYIEIPIYGKVAQIQSLIVEDSPLQIKFKGVLDQTLKIPGISTDVQFLKGLAEFEVSKSRIALQANGGFVVSFSVKGAGVLDFDVATGAAGFSSAIPPKGFNVTGKMTVEVPLPGPVPPVKVDLEGTATLTKEGLSGTGKAAIFSIIDITKGDVNILTKGKMIFKTQTGMFIGKVIEMNLLGQQMELDIPSVKLTAGLSQDLSIINGMLKIPGPVKGDLTIDGKQKLITVSGKAGFSIAPFAGDALAFGLKNFLVKVEHYDASNPEVSLHGDLYASVWTFAEFDGKVTNFVLDGQGNFMLPPGLKQLLDLEKISLPIKIDMKSGQVLGELGGQVAGLAIKHFPLEGPEILVKNDGVHLKGKIGIVNVISIPLGDIVFKKDESHTTLSGDAGIGPFTLAEGNFTLPADNSAGIGFSGQMGIPGLAKQKLSGTIYRDGKLEFSSLNKIGFINVSSMSKLAVSKAGLHADTARFSIGLGGAAECALAFIGLDITPSKISGMVTGSFTGVLGIGTSLSGTFSFDGQTVVLGYPDAVTLCGISVSDATLNISLKGVTGSGKITAAGKSTTVSITVENGIMKLRGPAGELIAEGVRIAGQLADTTVQIASDEKEVVEEDAGDTMENLSRMTEPWVKDMLVVVRAAQGVYDTIEKIVVDEVFARVKAVLDNLKVAVEAGVAAAKKAIDAAVDGVCDGIVALIDSIKGIFSDVESLLPAQYLDTYRAAKNKVIEKAAILRQKVVLFRDDTKGALYGLTSVITDIYQSAIDMVTSQANSAASSIKKQAEPVINEIDQLLTEVGQEVKAAKNAVGDEATRHYDIAKQKAGLVKEKANGFIDTYKNKIKDLVSPYIKAITDKLAPYADQAAKKRDEAIAKGIEGLATAKKALDPYIQPFEDALNEVKNLLSNAGGAAYDKFLEGVGAAGDALNKGLGVAGKGLVKATDILGDGVVAASDAAAKASQTAHQAAETVVGAASDAAGAVANGASVAINYVQDTGSHAINVTVSAANQAAQSAGNAANQASQAASSAASQAYTAAFQVANSVQQQASSTINNVVTHLPSVTPSSFATGAPVNISQLQSASSSVSSQVSGIIGTLSGYGSSAYGAASSAASQVGSAISSGASSVAGGLSSGWKSASGRVAGFLGIGSSGSSTPPPPDYTAPTITNISATSTTNSITVTWTTSFNARTLLLYKTQSDVNLSGAGGGTLLASIHDGDNYPETISHSITVNNLNPGTTYYYIVYSYRMVSGNASDVAKQGVYLIATLPTTAIIGGKVKDAQGGVVVGAKIYVDNGTTPVATSGSGGAYAVEVNPGTHSVTVRKDNYLVSSATISNLVAGQIQPMDFALADGRIFISGIVKDASSNSGIASATVNVLGLPATISVPTDANGAFTVVLGTSGASLQVSLTAAKTGFVSYASGSMTLAPGAKVQNIEIKLAHVPPAVTSSGVDVGWVTTNTATVFFDTQAPCSSFVQFGPQSGANYLYQTSLQSNKSSFSFELTGLNPGTAYKFKVVLQDGFGNTVVANESFFYTSQPSITLNAAVDHITGNNAKLNIDSTPKTLQHRVVLMDMTTNTQILNQDVGVLASPVSLDLSNLTDGHSYKVDLTSLLLANGTSGQAVKSASKSVTFATSALSDFEIKGFDVQPDTVKRGVTGTVKITASVKVNHAVSNAVLKVFSGSQEIYSQNLNSLSPGDMQLTLPLAAGSVPGVDNVPIKMKLTAGASQDSRTKTIRIESPKAAGANQPGKKSSSTGAHATAI